MHLKTFSLFLLILSSTTALPFRLMLQPAGSARHPGRSIHGSFERGLSIQLAEQLKELLELKDPTIEVIIARFGGQNVEPLEQANIANRLSIDAYIALMLYEQEESNAQLALYTYASDPSDALKTTNKKNLQFIPFDQAHIAHHSTSYRMADVLLTSFKANPLFTVMGNTVHAMPLKTVMGIVPPHMALELSIQSPKKMKQYAQALADALLAMIQSIKQWNPRP